MKMVKRGSGYIIEDRDTYKGYEYAVTFTSMGHRCAYIILPKPIEFKNEDITEELSDKYNYWDNVNCNLDLPGGLTYLNYHNLDLKDENKLEFTIGWDYISHFIFHQSICIINSCEKIVFFSEYMKNSIIYIERIEVIL